MGKETVSPCVSQILSQAVTTTTNLTPMAMLERAVTGGADIEVLERLMGLSERWQENQARAAFSEALSALRDDLPQIIKTKSVSFGAGKASYKYEDLADVVEQLSTPLATHGLSFRWRTDSTEAGLVKVTCILSHRDGHSEETTLAGPFDNSGNKNPIQAIGSVVTYLQRYTLKAAIGIAAAADDDGQQGAPQKPKEMKEIKPASDAQKNKFLDLVEQAVDKGLVGSEVMQKSMEWLEGDPPAGAVGAQIGKWSDAINDHESKLVNDMPGLDEAAEPNDEGVDFVDPNQIDIEGSATDPLNQICEQLKLSDPEAPVGETFKDQIVAAGEKLGVPMAYPLVKLRGLASEFDAERFQMKAKPFPYEEVPVHIAMVIVDYVAEKAGVAINI